MTFQEGRWAGKGNDKFGYEKTTEKETDSYQWIFRNRNLLYECQEINHCQILYLSTAEMEEHIDLFHITKHH